MYRCLHGSDLNARRRLRSSSRPLALVGQRTLRAIIDNHAFPVAAASVWESKKVKWRIAVNGLPSHSYGTSLAIWDHIVYCYLLPDASERAPP